MWSELKRYKRTRLIFAAILASAFSAGVISCSCTGGLHSLSLSAQRFAAKCVALPAATDGIGICIATALTACLIPVLLCLFSYLFGFTVYSPPVSGAAVAAFSFCMGAVCAATASPDIPYLLRALLCQDAETLLMDEPFTGMDAELVRLAVQTTVRLAGQRPAILITHDLAAAQMLGWPIREL